MIMQLGSLPDETFAQQWNMSVTTVTRKRLELGKKSPRRSQKFSWSNNDVAKLGMMSDSALASQLTISKAMVTRKRHQLGIPPFHKHQGTPKDWSASMLSDLQHLTVRCFSERYQINGDTVRKKLKEIGLKPVRQRQRIEWTAAMIARLGQASDVSLAKDWNIAHTTVRKKRLALGIAAFKDH